MSKYCRLDLFKEVAIGFNYSLQTTSKYPASLFDGIFILMVKCYRYPYLQFIFGVTLSFVGLPLGRALHWWDCNLGELKRSDVRDNVVVETF